ncbi:kinesin-like protein KIF18A isoform X2 [Haliotis rufescens]|uniref:kinesin-like protein KIF18A isoform X2 n=1 Tax=Haliotis rufescens TaxID=6454 RepID=UPI00201EDD04|nr:kinesin-like protein KIF18A isoform X2 [Haliotis rufescens]
MTVGRPRSDRSMAGSERNHVNATKSSNVKVVVRIRPENAAEKVGPFEVVVRDMNEHVLAFDPKESNSPVRGFRRQPRDIRKRRNKDLKFAFDFVFGPCTTNAEVYEHTTKGILDGLLEGYNCSVFAYGATGAGKTHTMLGSETRPGVMYHTMIDLYERIANLKDEKTCDVAISYLEVYNEQIQDLLLPRGSLPIREDPNTGVIVPGLSLHKPKNAEELLYMLQFGNKNRSQHPTDANAESSRSHAVFQVFVRQKDRTANISAEVKVAKMCLVDLAGSERATVTKNRGARFREGANINRSLLALGNVINALAENKNKGHIPYRDSKLTRLLKDSLGGNCRTVMIAAVSPSSMSYEDTYNTLKYADRAKHIRAMLKKNILNVDFHVSRYGQIVEDLRKEIGELKSRLQLYDEGKMGSSRRQSAVNEEQRLSAILENIFEARLDVRREQLQVECVYRDLLWKIGRKQRCLHRLRVISSAAQGQVCERVERSLKSLQGKMEAVTRKRDAAEVKLAANQDWLNRVHSELCLAGGDNAVPELLSVSLRMHNLEVEVRDCRHHTKHLQKLIRSQEKETTATDRLVANLLALVRKQHFILKGHNLATSDLLEEFDVISQSVDGREVTWEDETAGDGTGVPINDIISLPLLPSVLDAGGAQRVMSGQSTVSTAAAAARVVDGPPHCAPGSLPSHLSLTTEADPSMTSQSVNAGHTPAFKKMATLHTDGSAPPSASGQWQRLNDTFARNPVTGPTEEQGAPSSPTASVNSDNMDGTFTLEPSHIPSLVQSDVCAARSEAVSSSKPSLMSSLQPSQISPGTSYVPKIDFEYVCQSPLSRSTVVRQTVDSLDQSSPFRRTSCLPRKPSPVPTLCASPIPVPPSVQAYLSSQPLGPSEPQVSAVLQTQGSTQCNTATRSNPVNLKGSSTITKCQTNLYGSATITKSQVCLSGSSTVTKSTPGQHVDKENEDHRKNSVVRSITFGGECQQTPDRPEMKSYADVLKTPSPVRLRLKTLDSNTPVSSPYLPSASCRSVPGYIPPESGVYKATHKSEETARNLSQFGLPSVANRSAPRLSKPSYMRPTKAATQRTRHLFGRVKEEAPHSTAAPPRRVAAPDSHMQSTTANKSLSRMRSKSMSSLSGRGRWQH